MYEDRFLGDHQFMLQDLMYMYLGRHDADIRMHIMNGGEIAPEVMAEYIGFNENTGAIEEGLIDSELTQQEKDTAQVLSEDLQDAYNRISATYEASTGRTFGFITGYLPIIGKTFTKEDIEQDLVITMLRGKDQEQTFSGRGFLLERQIATLENAKQIRTDLWGIWQDYANKQEQYINLNEWGRSARAFIQDPTIAATISQNYDPSWTKGIEKYVEDAINPTRLHTASPFQGFIRHYRHNVAVSNLAMKSNIILRQLPSGLLYVEEAGLGEWINSQKDFALSFYWGDGRLQNRMVDNIVEKDPSTIESKLETDFMKYKHTKYPIIKFKRKMDKFGMGAIHAADIAVKTIGWTAVYNRYLPDLGEQGAIEKARDYTARTQPSSNKASLPGMYRENEMWNAFFMFTQQPVKLLNHFTGTVLPNLLTKDGNKMAGFYGLTALAVSNGIIWAMTNRRLPDEPEEWIVPITLGGLRWIPGIGGAIANYWEGKNEYSASQYKDPVIGVLEILNLPGMKDAIAETHKGNMGPFNKKWRAIWKGTGTGLGLPYGGAKNLRNAMIEDDWWSHLFLGGPQGEEK